MPVRRRLSLTYASLGKLIPDGVGLISLINIWNREMFFRHSMLHLYSTQGATLVPDWAGSFGSFNTARANWCLDLSFRSCSLSVYCTGTFHIGGVLASKQGEQR